MTSADSCFVTTTVTGRRAFGEEGKRSRPPRIRTRSFTTQPQHLPYLFEPGVSSCCADLPGDWALYAISVRRLI